jgi:hypothetical protein
LLHVNADWLKEYVKSTIVEVMPNVGYSNKAKAQVSVEKKEYKNLDGLMRFINITLSNNKDVYFVTAKKAIEWMGLLERLEIDEDPEALVRNQLFDDCSIPNEVYDGKCPILKQSEPDFNQDDDIILDDSFGEELKKKLKISHGKDSLLMDLQSEVLFMNESVLYFVLSLALVLATIILKDQYF